MVTETNGKIRIEIQYFSLINLSWNDPIFQSVSL